MTTDRTPDRSGDSRGDEAVARPSRRDVLGSAAAAGLVALSLPRAAQASSIEGSGGSVLPNLAPATITDLAATAGPGSITLTFTAPNDNGSSITGYHVYRTVDGVPSSFTTRSGATGPIVVEVLDPTVAYEFSVAAANGNGEAARSSTVVETPDAVATGGTVTYFTADGTNGTSGIRYAVHTFVDDGGSAIGADLVLNAGRSVDYLVVAGGGSGGTAGDSAGVWGTGGGGAGGVREGSVSPLVAGTYGVTVGGRRTAPERTTTIASNQGLPGNGSSFHTVTATGGGAGGTYGTAGGTGGSGGGGGGRNSTSGGAGNAGIHDPVEGRAGGSARGGDTPGTSGGGGGGGAGAVGSNGAGSSSSTGGNGGAGIQSRIDGTARHFAGGGGGGATQSGGATAGSGGQGGGGAGSTSGAATSGTNGTGGGGGGVGIEGVGGSGGSGIVVVRYPITALTY